MIFVYLLVGVLVVGPFTALGFYAGVEWERDRNWSLHDWETRSNVRKIRDAA